MQFPLQTAAGNGDVRVERIRPASVLSPVSLSAGNVKISSEKRVDLRFVSLLEGMKHLLLVSVRFGALHLRSLSPSHPDSKPVWRSVGGSKVPRSPSCRGEGYCNKSRERGVLSAHKIEIFRTAYLRFVPALINIYYDTEDGAWAYALRLRRAGAPGARWTNSS